MCPVSHPPRGPIDSPVDIVDVEPNRTLFIDDQPLNVDGANSFGLVGQWFDIANAAEAWSSIADQLGVTM